ncbi:MULTISPECIES: hypothetical protein [unclassified Streptomyces]|uniref:hypothetical protein n=1 Tax=unclassified Streptomyces TaxID=2593676 RepID=UPI003402FCE9
MKTETYKGRTIKVVAGRGANWGYTRITLNGVDMGTWMQSENEALRSTRGTIDHADEVGVSSARYGAEWYAPGTYELCDEGHAKEIGGECGHSWCAERRAESAPVVEETAEIDYVSGDDLHVGDVVAYPGRPQAQVVRDAEDGEDFFGRPIKRLYCRALDGSREGFVDYGLGGVLPKLRRAA